MVQEKLLCVSIKVWTEKVEQPILSIRRAEEMFNKEKEVVIMAASFFVFLVMICW